MAQILWGFGGVKFDDAVTVATFSGAVGKITYIPIQSQFPNINDGISSRLRGYRVEIDVSELYNIDSDDYVQYQNLATILSGLVNSAGQGTVTITPRNDSTITNNITYTCILTSPFSPEDVHRVKTGQRVDLSFTCINKVTTIPTTVSDTAAQNYIDGTDTYIDGTDTYIDGLG